MKGDTQMYDVIVLIGTILLIFVVFYWAVDYGSQQVSNMLYSSPTVVQDSLASFVGAGCVASGNMTVELAITPTPLVAMITDKAINVLPPSEAYRLGRTVERGGYVKYGPPDPIPYVRCTNVVAEKGNSSLDPLKNKAFAVNKTGGTIKLEVR